MARVFSRRESDRARLGRSKKTSFWPPTTPTNSPSTGKSSSGRVGQNTLTRTLSIAYKPSLDNARSIDFSQCSSSTLLIEDKILTDSDMITNLIENEDGQEEPDCL
ncbi:hypothetical protein TNCV_3576281 [Trichonephila clavipes]|nr:hypothetical protein TNCV_3576281 [Trichonephila clavipes]